MSGPLAGGVIVDTPWLALIVETRVREPIVPLGMFRNPTISLATITTVAVGTAMFGGTVFLGQYFQIARGYIPTEAGLMTLCSDCSSPPRLPVRSGPVTQAG